MDYQFSSWNLNLLFYWEKKSSVLLESQIRKLLETFQILNVLKKKNQNFFLPLKKKYKIFWYLLDNTSYLTFFFFILFIFFFYKKFAHQVLKEFLWNTNHNFITKPLLKNEDILWQKK